MTANPIKPGTRCECRNGACCRNANGHGKCEHYRCSVAGRGTTDGTCDCREEAVHMVTVPPVPSTLTPNVNAIREQSIPMCAPCAEYASKAGAQ